MKKGGGEKESSVAVCFSHKTWDGDTQDQMSGFMEMEIPKIKCHVSCQLWQINN